MILAVRCNMPSFKGVEFKPGFNVVLADRTKDSTRKDSRNGLGKTTLIEIIHFCLGAQARKNRGLLVAPLKGWSFTLEMRVNDRELVITRSTDDPRRIHLDGDVQGLFGYSGHLNRMLSVNVNDWTSLLGELFFGLSQNPVPKYHPTFRSLLSYFARRGREAFASPFIHHRSQREWDKQVNNAFLLDLNWEHASQLRELKDEDNLLNSLRQAAREGLLQGMIGTLGNLEAERARLESEVRQHRESLSNFRVHPLYEKIEQEATDLTSAIQQLTNANFADGRLADLYRRSLEDDQVPIAREVLLAYQEVEVVMPELVRRRLYDVEQFHRQILANRRAYLESEIQEIEAKRIQRRLQISTGIEKRSRLFELCCRTHEKPWKKFTRLRETALIVAVRRSDATSLIIGIC